MPNDVLPTITSPTSHLVSFYKSLTEGLEGDVAGESLRFFFYAVTQSGWLGIRRSVLTWKRKRDKDISAYVGTDHALTDPDALRAMLDDGIKVRIMRRYTGVYHPKMVWITGSSVQTLWVGSNNLTSQGLRDNIEFAVQIIAKGEQPLLESWFNTVHMGSDLLDDKLLMSYAGEREKYNQEKAKLGEFTWTKRTEPPASRVEPAPTPVAQPKSPVPPTKPVPVTSASPLLGGTRSLQPARGDLIVEIMPRETGQGGKQIQLPKEAAVGFFNLPDRVDASIQVVLESISTGDIKSLTMTLFENRTTRLSISELDYLDRPCLIVFRRIRPGSFQFEIVQRSIYPDRYREYLNRCGLPTRHGSRHWAIVR